MRTDLEWERERPKVNATLEQLVSKAAVPAQGPEKWPMEVRALLSALCQPMPVPRDRRGGGRRKFEVVAILHFNDGNGQRQTTEVYTRDASSRGVGLVTSKHFNVGQAVILELSGQDGLPLHLKGRIHRCRQFREGWFETLVLEEVAMPPAPPPSPWARLGKLVGMGKSQ
jgi:hypothetical protein